MLAIYLCSVREVPPVIENHLVDICLIPCQGPLPHQYTDELAKMGADISAHGSTAIVKGVDKLYSAPVQSHDLRAGAAMIIAGLIADGKTEVTNIEHILRGYEDITEKFRNLGADIKLVDDESIKGDFNA